MPFKPGQSGNPKGRPARDDELARMLTPYVPDAVRVLVACMRNGDRGTSLAAAKECLDRVFGKAPQHVGVEVGGDLPTLHLLAVQALNDTCAIEALAEEASPVLDVPPELLPMPAATDLPPTLAEVVAAGLPLFDAAAEPDAAPLTDARAEARSEGAEAATQSPDGARQNPA